MNDFLILLTILALLFLVGYLAYRYVFLIGDGTINNIAMILLGLLALRLAEKNDLLPSTIIILATIPLMLMKIKNEDDK